MNSRWLCRLSSAALVATLLVASLRVSAEDSTPVHSPAIVAALQPFVDSHSLAGAVTLVADKDRVLCVDTVGYADVAAKKPMQADSLFWIASQTKPITSAALMILVDEGKVSLDDPMEKHLPEFKDQWLAVEQDKEHVLLKKPKRPITVRDLLRHTSGMPYKSAMEQPTLDLLPLHAAVRSYVMTPLTFEPGEKYLYSNPGINTAGRIIEVASGMSYQDFLNQRLLRPLGMKDTTYWPNEEQLTRLAKSYRPNSAKDDLVEMNIAQLKYPLNDPQRQPMPGGGLFSTADDVRRFCQMLLNGGTFQGKRILSEAAVAEMTKRQTGENISTSYGLGLSVGNGSYGHGGAQSTNMTIDTQRGLITVFLVQHAGFPGDGKKSLDVFRKAAEAEFAKETQPAK